MVSHSLAPVYLANVKLEFFADVLTECFHWPDVICEFVDLHKTFLRLKYFFVLSHV